MPEVVIVRVEDLVLPETFVSEVYVQRLVENFNQDMMGPIHAKKRRDGRWEVTDGVHRAVAADRAGIEAVRVYPHA